MNIYEAEKWIEDENRSLKSVDQNAWKYAGQTVRIPKVVQYLVRWLHVWPK